MNDHCPADASKIEVQSLIKTFTVRNRSLTKTRFAVLDNVSLHLKRGETLGLVGESGCGKSTFGRCLLHLIPVDGGTISIDGTETQDMTEAQFRPLRRKIQMVFQNPVTSFNPYMTLGQSLMDSMRSCGELSQDDKKQRVREVLEQVELDDRFSSMYPQEVSGGQLQRVGLARALTVRPEFMFLDEPTASLDMSVRGQVVNLLLDLQDRLGMGFIFVSHDLRVVRYLADRVSVMYLGQIVEEGSKQDVFDSPLHPYTKALLAVTHVGQKGKISSKLRGELFGSRSGNHGCKLSPRCEYAVDRCLVEDQQLIECAPARKVRCWRVTQGDLPSDDITVLRR